MCGWWVADATGSYDCTIRAWSLATFARVAVLEGHSDAVRALTVAGGRLFSGSYDNTVRVWDVDPMQVRDGSPLGLGDGSNLLTAS